MMSSVNHDDFAHLRIPLADVLSATNNFAGKNDIGLKKGMRYKGQLLWSGELIDIIAWRLNKELETITRDSFWMEISILSSLKHKNLISLVGFCDENDEKIIITRFDTRGSLCNKLGDPMLLTWVKRLEICVGLAHALSYIHYDEHRDFSVIHRNIDSETVILNNNWEPMLSQFRFSMKIEAPQRHDSFHVDKVWDREGYTDPTYIETKTVSHKSDIYSFGIVMFELLCSRKAVIEDDQDNKYLASVAVTHYREKKLNEMIDWDLWSQMDSQSFNIFTEIAYECLNEERSQRPNIDEIVMRLEKALELQLEHQNAIMNEFAHLRVPLQNILSATNNFSQQNLLGEDGIEKRYKGQLLWSGELIDIRARRLNKELDGVEQLFWMEISMLSSLKHKNVVSLVGFCDENDEKIIITRYETRLSLSNYLSDPMLLTWVRRLEISVGIAHALSYIHYDESRDFSVIHRNLDSSSIQLNDDLEPKLGGFIHSMKIKASERHNSFNTDKVWSTDGYTDPTYIETKSASHKSDMYSFGIVMFELLCGREAVINDDQDNKYLASVAVTYYSKKKLNEIIVWELWNQMDSQSFNVFAEIAYDCLNEERSQRPNIDEIVTRLEKALELQLEHQNAISSLKDELAHLKIPLIKIQSATNNFSYKNRINIWGNYKGQLSWSDDMIDIYARRLDKFEREKEGEFWMKVSLLSSLKHKNVVSFVGFCDENVEKIIITRRETRATLNEYLDNPMLLTWVKRLEVSVGVAHALNYIHYDESRDFSVIHRNVSSKAVLLNDDWEPKLSEFQHSIKIKASERHHSFHTYSVWSRKRYTDPTCEKTNIVNRKSDIYSFGIVLFELLCGRQSVIKDRDNKYLAPVAIFHYREKILDEIIDPDLLKQIDSRSLNIFAEIAYECLSEEQTQRPNMNQIVTRLERALELQLEWKNAEHSSLVAEVGDTSSSHEKGSVTFASIGNESQVSKNTESFSKDLSHLKLSIQDLKSATNNFDEEYIINRDERIFKGRLLRSKQFIDIVGKEYKSDSEEDKKFRVELSMLSSLKHKNLVSLIGFYDDQNSRIIVYKKEANESLENYLSDQTLTWMQRLKICVGIGNALSYIHYDAGRDFSVIHCNVRSSKILLDDEWEPKLSGFELALKNTVARRHRLLLTRDIVKDVYLDPKYKETGGVTHKSDVYSFGVVLFEVVCGRSAVYQDDDKDDEDEDANKDDNDDEDDDEDNELREGLLSQLAKSRFDEMIMPHLRSQMDPELIYFLF